MITKQQLDELIGDLTGTCNSLAEALAKFDLTEDDLTLSDNQDIDANIFCCDSCGWWCGIEEMTEVENAEMLGGQHCSECMPDVEE